MFVCCNIDLVDLHSPSCDFYVELLVCPMVQLRLDNHVKCCSSLDLSDNQVNQQWREKHHATQGELAAAHQQLAAFEHELTAIKSLQLQEQQQQAKDEEALMPCQAGQLRRSFTSAIVDHFQAMGFQPIWRDQRADFSIRLNNYGCIACTDWWTTPSSLLCLAQIFSSRTKGL
jgi:hypothetical protein